MHSEGQLLLQLFAIFVSAKVFGEIFEQLSLPGVLGEILAGVILGPYMTALIIPTETIGALAELGAIFLLFTVGLETSPQDLIKVGRQSLYVALAGIAAPFILGFGYLMLRGEEPHEATFVAAAMVATSVGITARVLGDLGVLKTRVAKIILGAAVFDDIIGMVLLAVVVGLASAAGIQWLHLSIVLIEAVGFAVVMIFFGPKMIHHLRPGLQRMETHNAPLILALAICLGLSVAATRIGLAAIIGAFFAGLSFADRSKEWNLEPRLRSITEFLSPYFFFIMGTKLNLKLFHGDVIWVAIVISILAVISKVGGCGLAVLRREGWMGGLQVGVGMMPRGEVALIIALIGLNMNIISQKAYAVVLLMTAVTTMLAPPLLRILFRNQPQAAAATTD